MAKKKSTALATTVAEFGPVAQALQEFERQFGSLVFDCSTKDGDRDARRARQCLKDAQSTLEKARVAKKAPLLESIREIDSEAKRIDAILEKLKAPIHNQIKAEEERAELERLEKLRAEERRVSAIRDRIRGIANAGLVPARTPADDIRAALIAAQGLVVNEELFGEFVEEAAEVLDDTLRNLEEALDVAEQVAAVQKVQQEMAAMRQRLADLEREKAERDEESKFDLRTLDSPKRPAPAEPAVKPADRPPVPTRVSPLDSRTQPAMVVGTVDLALLLTATRALVDTYKARLPHAGMIESDKICRALEGLHMAIRILED